MRRIVPILFVIPALAGLAGCSRDLAEVPSLAPRPAERQPILPPDQATEPNVAASPALAAELARLVGDAKSGHAAFEKERAALGPAIARGRGAAEGSEAWIAGQEALSALQGAQGKVRDAAAAIEAQRSIPAYAGIADRAAIDAAAFEVGRLAEAEAKALDSLG